MPPLPSDPARLLVVYVHRPERLSYFDDWRDAFARSPLVRFEGVNLVWPGSRRRIRRLAPVVDGIVLLHSVIGDTLDDFWRCEPLLHSRRGPLVCFVGNEVSLPGQPFAAKVAALAAVGPEIVATQLLREAGDYLYSGVHGARVASIPHALNPAVFRPRTPAADRQWDVGFRGARYPDVVGDDDRNELLDGFGPRAGGRLRIDIAPGVVIGRQPWARFLDSCRSVLAAESGSWLVEDGTAVVAAEAVPSWLQRVTRMAPRPVRRAIPASLRARVRAVPASVDARHLRPAPVYTKCLASRHFDAIGTETCQVMWPGRYNDLLVAGQHYIALERDWSNLEDVVAQLQDDEFRNGLARAARQFALDGHTHLHRVRDVVELVRSAP